ncbi:hypothetical protein V8G54_019411, partial [Vigna mungo]
IVKCFECLKETLSVESFCRVLFKSPSQYHLSFSPTRTCIFLRLGALWTSENVSIRRQSLTTKFSSEGNFKSHFSELQKQVRLGRDTNSIAFRCLNSITCVFSSSATIFSIP